MATRVELLSVIGWNEAQAVADQALREARAALPPGHSPRLAAQMLGAVVQRLRGDFKGAREALAPTLAALRDAREAMALSLAHYGERHHETLTSYSVLAMAALAAQEPHEALAVARNRPASGLVADARRLRDQVALAEGVPALQSSRVCGAKVGVAAPPTGAAPQLPLP